MSTCAEGFLGLCLLVLFKNVNVSEVNESYVFGGVLLANFVLNSLVTACCVVWAS